MSSKKMSMKFKKKCSHKLKKVNNFKICTLICILCCNARVFVLVNLNNTYTGNDVETKNLNNTIDLLLLTYELTMTAYHCRLWCLLHADKTIVLVPCFLLNGDKTSPFYITTRTMLVRKLAIYLSILMQTYK